MRTPALEDALECPEEHLLLELLAGTLSAPSADRLHAHMDRCTGCQRLVGELARAESLEDSDAYAGGDVPLMAGARLDRYFILGQVGVGGMGTVYAAFDPALDRKVALKLLNPSTTPGDSPEARHQWLLSEAQALARLSHPHVVTVHEARVFGERLFLTMEYAEGGTLETWLGERRRSWREILQVFLAAGEGLEAAHAAGLVHRDFKPANVLVRRDGRVQVTDFGLARRLEPLPGQPTRRAIPISWRTARAGTPAYMAPEQQAGREVDARADQYSFCVALYEALLGQRPPAPQADGRLAFPRGRRIPWHVRRALQRGLSRDAPQRFDSMEALRTALRHEPLAAWRVPLLSAAALALLAVGGVLEGARESPSPCQAGARRWEGVWDAERQRAVREALERDGSTGAATWRGVQGALEAYAQAWVAHYTEACEATRVHGEQSEALLDARMHCLERRVRDFQALTQLLAREGTRTDTAVEAAWRLPALESCAAPHAQAALQGLPAGGPLRERAESIAQRLSETRALKATGQGALALEHALRAREELEQLDHGPTRAEVFLELGGLYTAQSRLEQAEKALLEAAWTAEAARYDRLVATARIGLLFLYGDSMLRPALDAPFVREAQAAVARLGGDAQLEASFEWTLGSVLVEQHRCAEALPHIERARVLLEKTPPDSPSQLGLLVALGRGHQCKGELDVAQRLFHQATRLRERSVGPDHPRLVPLLLLEGRAALMRYALDDALALFQRALALQGRVRAPNAEEQGVIHVFLSEVLFGLDRLEEARAHALEALAHYERHGTEHPTRKVDAWLLLGELETRLGRPEEGRVVLERALRAAEGQAPMLRVKARMLLADCLFKAGRELPRARRLALEGYRIISEHPGTPPGGLQRVEQHLGALGIPVPR